MPRGESIKRTGRSSAGTGAFYRRHLPHIQPTDAVFHIVFRLAGSLPMEAIERIRQERAEFRRRLEHIENRSQRGFLFSELQRKTFRKYEELLDRPASGPVWLKIPQIAEVVDESMKYRDGRHYTLLAHAIMSNHVHMVISVGEGFAVSSEDPIVGRNDIPTDSQERLPLFRILQSLKRHTARQCNLLLHRAGPFWQAESYDHIIRDTNELIRTLRYVVLNPVTAGLVGDWREWPWTFLREERYPFVGDLRRLPRRGAASLI